MKSVYLREVAVEVAGRGGGGDEEPTLFTNDSTEVQMVFNLGSADQPRRLVMNQVTEKVAVIGEEAFMEPVKSTETTLGAFAGLNTAGFDIDIGLRWDDVERKGTIREMHQDDEHVARLSIVGRSGRGF